METVTQILESRLENIDFAEDIVIQAARRRGFTEGSVARIGLAVREIFANAVIHGNRYDLTKNVSLEMRGTVQQLEIAISDQGRGFDPNLLPDPTDSDSLLRPSGRGLFLARMFMDEFHILRGRVCGVTITMVKYLRRT
jgi:serine/threonine-protein kinase RsbW